MKINDKEFLNPQQQLYQNTKDIEDLKEKYKGEIYAALPYSEWPEDVVLEQVEDPREFTYVPRAITNVPADAKYGYFLMNVEDFEDPSNSAALLFKIKSVNNSTVYIEFYANVASHVPGPQGEKGDTGAQGPAGQKAQILITSANLSTTVGNSTVISVTTIQHTSGTYQYHNNDVVIGANGYMGYVSLVDPTELTVKTTQSIVGPQGQATIGIQVVAELPASGTEGVIYLVPTEDPETGNAYDEYIYTNSAWEKFGYVDIDLSDYALKSEIPVIDEDLIPKAFNTYVLGDNTHSYKEVVANKFKTPNDYFNITSANVSGHGVATLRTTDGNGTNEGSLQISNLSVSVNKNLVPTTTGINLGSTSSQFNNLNLAGKILTDDNLTYGLALPDTTSFTADKTLATTDQIPTLPTYSISNVVTDQSDVLGLQVTDGSVTYNIYNTTANPTLAGTESDLTSIDIGGTAYSIPSGTNVTANPTLAGTETALTSIEIGSTKYSIPSGGGSATDVQINGTSIVSSGTANIITNSAYNASSNKIATMSDVPVIDENIVPKTNNTYTLGDASHLYSAGYIKRIYFLENNYNASISAYLNGNTPEVRILSRLSSNTNTFTIAPSQTIFSKNLFPDGTIDIGEAYAEFNNLYLQGNIYTDENQSYGLVLPDTTSYTANKTLATVEDGAELQYVTSAPSAANTSGNLKGVVLTSEPGTYYNGYIYYITEA